MSSKISLKGVDNSVGITNTPPIAIFKKLQRNTVHPSKTVLINYTLIYRNVPGSVWQGQKLSKNHERSVKKKISMKF